MPEIATNHFGVLEYTEDSIIRFPLGLPGFEDEKEFLLIEQLASKPLVFMQSLGRAELCFILVPAIVVCPGYKLSAAPEDLSMIGMPADRQHVAGDDLLCLAIVSADEDRPPTANLLAPVLVNVAVRTAVQAVQSESPYSHQHPLFAPAEEAPCS